VGIGSSSGNGGFWLPARGARFAHRTRTASTHHSLVAVGVVTEPEPTARFSPNHRAVSLHRAGLESCLSLGFLMLW